MRSAQTLQDRAWIADGDSCGWSLPAPAPWLLRLPIVRGVRAVLAAWKLERHYAVYGVMGLARSGYDEWVVYAIARGWC